jgi:hypothetical protein
MPFTACSAYFFQRHTLCLQGASHINYFVRAHRVLRILIAEELRFHLRHDDRFA